MEESLKAGIEEVSKLRENPESHKEKERKPDIIMISTTGWDRLRQRPEQLALRLAKDRRVLYVEPFGESRLIGRFSNMRSMGNIRIYTPPDLTRMPILGKAMSLFLGRLNVSLLISDLKNLCRQLSLHKPVLLITNPYSSRLVSKIGRALAVYDCVDDWPAFSRYPEEVWEKEKKLIKRCDAILATSQRILERRKAYAKKAYVVPNAADFEHFHKVLTNEVQTATEISRMKKPVIGYIGALYRWVDFDLIRYIAKKNPSWNIALIGPSKPHLLASLKESNIHFLGKKPYEQLPSYLKGIDVCIVPFEVSGITLSVDPVKVYEYLAAGKPVVSTLLPELKKFGSVVRIAKDHEDFGDQIGEALEEDGSLASERVNLARQNTWESRANQISQIFDDLLLTREQGGA